MTNEEIKISDYEEDKITNDLIAENDATRFKAIIQPKLLKVLESYKDKKVLKADCTLIKSLKDELNEVLKEEEKSFKTTSIKGFISKLQSVYITNTEYDISLKINLWYQSGVNKRGDCENFYYEAFLYLAELKGDWQKYETKRISRFYGSEFKTYDIEETLNKFLIAKIKKAEFEKARDEISFYKVKEHLK